MSAAATEFDGQVLLDIADSSWNERRGEYHGGFFNGYNFCIGAAMRQDVKENGKNGRKRKARREESKRVIDNLLDHTRQQAAARLTAIAAEASAPRSASAGASEESELYQFAMEVMDRIQEDDQAFGTTLFGLIDPQFLITLIMTIIDAVKTCRENRNPKPAPQPA